MVKIKRLINEQEFEFKLTREEINKVFRQNNIQWAKDILENYASMIIDYENIVNDEEQLVTFAELLDKKNLANNGDRELEAINELFKTVDE
ncbi:hypothetical protein [Clostridium botulinum]|uniref:hypothetical protein n=1 Tax=Clostridium botulinum TaxID=1491 RepID=UPI0013CD48B7|nr:hypothetical protein [Clostridium botulinum]